MGFDDILRTGVAIANTLTRDGLQATVGHRSATGRNTYNEITLGDVTSRRAVVSDTNTMVRSDRGTEQVARFRILFLDTVTVTLEDEITLPSGRTTPILKIDSGVLADDGTSFYTEVWCG